MTRELTGQPRTWPYSHSLLLTPSAGMAPACRPLWGRSGSRGLPPPTSPAQQAAVVSHTQPGAVGGTQVHTRGVRAPRTCTVCRVCA